MQIPRTFHERPSLWIALALMLLVGIISLPVIACGFVNMDDNRYVTDNPQVRNGLTARNVAWAFGTNNPAGLWIPLTWLSLQTDATLSGPTIVHPKKPVLPGSPPPFPAATIYHLDNLLLQMASSACLFLFLDRATGRRRAAFLAALLWAIHPLRVESVAWITERKDVLAGVFGFLALLAYVTWAKRGGWWRYALACAAFLLSCMAKPLFVTLPALLIILDAWPLDRLHSWRDLSRRILEKWSFWIITLGISVVTFLAQRQVGAVKTLHDLGFGERLGHAVVSYATYLVRQVRVWDLAAYYSYGDRPALWLVVASSLALLAITALCLWQWKHRPWLLAGWAWYVVALFPMSGIVQAGDQGCADRFTYLPAVGLWIMVAFSVEEAWLKVNRPRLRHVIVALLATWTLTMIVFTIRQIGYWHNTETLATRALEVTDKNWFMHEMLAIAYLREGENERAEPHFIKAVEINPTVQENWFSLGFFHLQWGKNQEAVRELAKAARLRPGEAKSHFYHGVALERTGQITGAILEYRNALLLEPGNALAASSLERVMQDDKAFQEALKYAPELRRPR